MRPRDIPNALCVLRMLLVAPVVWLLLAGEYAWVLVVFFLAGFTDGLDGFLAKRFDWRSRLGGILDPLADKLLMVSSYLTLGWLGLIPSWLVPPPSASPPSTAPPRYSQVCASGSPGAPVLAHGDAGPGLSRTTRPGLRALIRSVLVVVLGLFIYWFYFSPLATFFLARVEGFAQPDDKPLVWTLMFLSIILIQSEFFDGWPLKRK